MIVTTHRTRLFVLNERDEFLIMVRNFKSIMGRNARVILLPGGGVDPGESSLCSVQRETHEELGITLPNIEKIYNFQSTRPSTETEKVYWNGATVMVNNFDFYQSKTVDVIPDLKEKDKFDEVLWGTEKTIHQLVRHYDAEIGDGILEALKHLVL